MSKAIAAWLLAAVAAATPATAPRDVVGGAVSRVVAILDTQGDRGEEVTRRRAELRHVAGGLFDFEEMSRRALSRHWGLRSRAQQQEFVDLFTDLLERSYVGHIESYAGEKITYPAETIDGSYVTVRSRITTRRRTETTLDYRMHVVEGRWKVFDIAVDGVSFVSTYRSEFDRIIRGSSYASLVERMKKKRLEIDALARRADPSLSASPTGR